jgi:hypothetical protein
MAAWRPNLPSGQSACLLRRRIAIVVEALYKPEPLGLQPAIQAIVLNHYSLIGAAIASFIPSSGL